MLRLPCIITILMGAANVASMYLLLRYTSLGAYAVILTTLVISAVHFVDAPLYAAHCLHLPLGTFYPALARSGASLAAGFAAAAVLRRVLPQASGWAALLGKGVVSAAVLLPVLVLVGLGPRQTARLVRKLKNKS